MVLFCLEAYPIQITQTHETGLSDVSPDIIVSGNSPYIGLKFKEVIPKSLWGTRPNELSIRTFLHFPYFSFSSILPCGKRLCLPKVTWCLLESSIDITEYHFSGIVICYRRWNSISLKEKRQCFRLCFSASLGTSKTSQKFSGKNVCTPVASPQQWQT